MRITLFILLFGFNIVFAQEEGNRKTQLDSDLLDDMEDKWVENLKSSTALFKDYENTNKSIVTEVTEKLLRARLDELDQYTPMDLSYNSVVHGYVERFLRMGHAYGKVMGMAEFYFPLFEEVLSKYEIPLEIKYLAIVESNLNAKASSRVGAKGLWQFMYLTGKAYGLEVNSYIDERYDPVKSTEAAAKYLSYLYNNLGDWNLALASYNCGLGNLNKAVRLSSGYKNYWDIRPNLPKETRGYIPSFVAVNYLMRYYKEQNITPISLKYSYYDTELVLVKERLTFKEISSKLDWPIEEIQFLNPQYKLGIIPKINGKKYFLRLPKTKARLFYEQQTNMYKEISAIEQAKKPVKSDGKKYQSLSQKYNPNQYHIVKSGHSLSLIAKKHGTTVQKLMSLNGLKSTALRIGQPIKYKEN